MGVYLMITKSQIILALLLSNALVFKMFVDRGDEIVKISSSLAESEAELTGLYMSIEKAQFDFNEVNDKNRKLQNELNETEYKLDTMKNRQETVFKKPKLVESMINKSYNEFQQEVLCATSQSDCP